MNQKSLEDLKLNLMSLEELKSKRGELPKDKEENYNKMNEYKYTLQTDIH